MRQHLDNTVKRKGRDGKEDSRIFVSQKKKHKMPRDNSKPSLIQEVATQAQIAFKNSNDGKDFLSKLAELNALLSEIRPGDLDISPPKKKSSGSGTRTRRKAPVTYMHICETRTFSMGVFALRSGVSIPLHDHPGMNGMLKVLYGKVRIRCFDKLDGAPEPDPDPGSVSVSGTGSGSGSVQKDAVCRAALRSSGEFTQQSAPCVLSPRKDNLHQIDALDGPAAFLDILAPPYDPDDGRDCHYYRVLRKASKNGDDKKGDETVCLLAIPQPEDFWCGSEPYPGPKVTV